MGIMRYWTATYLFICQKMSCLLPDAIIAATANTDDLCLVTRNVEDFKNIDVRILNPFD